jgi:putative membrane protein
MTSSRGPAIFGENGAVEVPKMAPQQSAKPLPIDLSTADVGTSEPQFNLGPAVIETDTATSRIEGWTPRSARPEERNIEQRFPMLTLGIAVLFFGTLAISAFSFVIQRFNESILLGTVALAVIAVGIGLIAAWGLREWHAFVALEKVEKARSAFSAKTPIEAARKSAISLISKMPLPEGLSIQLAKQVESEKTVQGIVDILRTEALAIQNDQAQKAIINASARLAGLVTLSPSQIGDTLIFVIRAGALIRQIARIYGLRPTGLSTLKLARRVMTSAGLVAATDVAVSTALQAFTTNPLVQMAIGDAAGTAVAAQRIYRIGRITMAECSPV